MIRNIITAAMLAGGATVGTPAFADSPFDGTWRLNPADMKVTGGKPISYAIANGTYRCDTCLPDAYSVKADGQFHAVKGRPYWDEVAVNVVDPTTVRYRFRKDGRIVSETTSTVSADGNTLSSKTHNTNNGAGAAVDSTASLTRAGPPPAGAHAISGSWNPAPPTAITSNALTMEVRIDGDTLVMKSPLGESLTAKFGGPYALNAGDPGKTMTKAERISATAFRLTDMSAGKVTQVSTFTLAPDGSSITGEWRDPRDGTAGRWIARKQ